MNFNPILIVSGEPNSVFLELFFKVINNNKINSPIILISSKKLLNLQMKKLGFKNKIRLINAAKLKFYKLDNKTINLIDVKYNPDTGIIESFKQLEFNESSKKYKLKTGGTKTRSVSKSRSNIDRLMKKK